MKPLPSPDYLALQIDEDQLRKEYSFGALDRDNPRSMINLMPTQTAKIIDAIPKVYFTMKESELKKFFKCRNEDTCIRLKFWDEYNYAQQNNTTMKTMNILHGVASTNYWQAEVLKSAARFAYILRAPIDYVYMMRGKLAHSMDDVDEILSASIYKKVAVKDARDEDGNQVYKKEVDQALVQKKIDLFKYLDQRVNGAIIQKLAIEQRSMNYHVTAGSQQQPTHELLTQEISTEEFRGISGKLKKLEQMLLDAGSDDEVEAEIDEAPQDNT